MEDEIEIAVTNGNSFRPKKDVKIEAMTGQVLDNDQVRFTLTYTAPAGIAINCYCTYLGGVESHFAIGKGRENETFTFDVDVAHLQDELGMVIMFYDEHMAFFAMPRGFLLQELNLPPKSIAPVSLAVIADPSRPRN